MTSTENQQTSTTSSSNAGRSTATARSSQAERSTDRLRTVLRINAASSMISGGVMAAIPNTIDDLLDTGRPGWIHLIGIGLMLFATIVAITARFDRPKLKVATSAIVVGDIGWVVGSVVTVLLGWYSGGGVVAVLAVAAMVDVFAVLQWRALRRVR